jgi:catechol 2,3-dioxygenase-like lactoylglutathione lyase family enzyme
MNRVAASALTGAALWALALPGSAQSPTGHDTLRPFLWQDGMTASEIGEVNVFRRFSSDRSDAMLKFYGEVLALPVLPQTALGGGQMIRYPLGASEVKLFPVAPSAANTAAVGEAIGARLLTFFFSDRDGLTSRFVEHGYEAPEFHSASAEDGTERALVQDPDGEWVELVIVPNAAAETLERFEIGITAGDLDASRAFYRGVLGLDEQPPVHDALLGITKYPFRHRATTINLWTFGGDLPKDAQTAGMQYIVWNVAGVDEVAQAHGADIDRPLSDPGQMRTIWLRDPDGVSNYFAEFSGNDNGPPPTR